MPYKFRLPGPWGPGSPGDLDPIDIDNNFWQAIQDIASKASQGVGISNIVQSGNQLTFVLTDHTLLGPYLLPVVMPKFKGTWQPSFTYLAGDIFSINGSTYGVNYNHTSDTTFDPGKNDGLGNDAYTLLLENSSIAIPVGGPAGTFLRKLTNVDLAMYWGTAALSELSDVFIPDSPGPQTGDVLTYSGGTWVPAPLAALSLMLSSLGDVEILDSPPPQVGHILTFTGTFWTNQFPAFNPTIFVPTPGQIITNVAGTWKNSNTADIPVLAGTNVFGSFTLDYSQGSVQRVVMSNGVTFTGVTNWPPNGQFGRLVLEVRNTGAFTWTWPTAYKWPGGAEPVVSPSGRDLFALTTFDGGINVDGSVIGQNYL